MICKYCNQEIEEVVSLQNVIFYFLKDKTAARYICFSKDSPTKGHKPLQKPENFNNLYQKLTT